MKKIKFSVEFQVHFFIHFYTVNVQEVTNNRNAGIGK